MNLGLMATAANAGMKADRDQQVFDYEQKKRESELSLLDDKTAADRSGYQLDAARKRVGLDLVSDPDYANTFKSNLKTANIRADLGLADAQNDQTNHQQTLQIKNNNLQGDLMTSNAELADLSRKLQQASVQGVLSQQGQADVVLGTLGQLIARKDKDAALRFANEIAKQPNVLPGTNGKPLSDIIEVRKGQVIGKGAGGQDITAQGDGYVFVNSDGQAHFNPVEAISGAMQKLKSGEYQFIHTNDGSVYSGNKQTGAVTQVHQGNPKINMLGDRRPREIQLFEFYKGLGYDQEGALAKVKELGHKSRQQFEADALKDALTTSMGRTPEEKAANAYAMVKRAADMVYGPTQGQGAPNAAPRITSAPSIDPKIRELLGIPGL